MTRAFVIVGQGFADHAAALNLQIALPAIKCCLQFGIGVGRRGSMVQRIRFTGRLLLSMLVAYYGAYH